MRLLYFDSIIQILAIISILIDLNSTEDGIFKRTMHEDEANNIEKIDLAIIVDTSKSMSKHLVDITKTVLELLRHFSISSGTTRVAFYTVSSNFKEHFGFRDHVNRECLLKSIKNITIKTTARKTKNFENLLRTGFEKIKDGHSDIDEQRRIYLYITNNESDIQLLRQEVDLTALDEVNIVLINNNKNKHQPKNGENNQAKKNSKRNRESRSRLNIIKFPTTTEHILFKLNIENKKYDTCNKKDSRAVDECQRHCKCVDGKLTDCFRLRKEFTSMTSSERRRYLKAYKTLTTKSPYKETYERFVFMHYKYFCWGIHTRDTFLPWHRWFVLNMEDLLRQIDCGVTVPYWDWSYVSQDPWNRTNLWRSTDDGLGRFSFFCKNRAYKKLSHSLLDKTLASSGK